MNPQNNIDSQRSVENPGTGTEKAPLRPGSNRESNQAQKRDRKLEKTEDDQAASSSGQEPQNYNEKHDEKKRYDEADPNWRNPDVEMDDQFGGRDEVNPELDSNLGPQS